MDVSTISTYSDKYIIIPEKVKKKKNLGPIVKSA